MTQTNAAAQPRAIVVQDISCVGRCSLTVALPVLSAAGVNTAVVPTALLSTHTGEFTGYTLLDLSGQLLPIARHIETLGLHFDAFYSGYLASGAQVEMVLEIRNLSEERLDRFAADAVTMGRAIPDVETKFQPIVRKAPVRCDGRIGKMLEGLCLKEGYSFRKMPSGATHDGNAMAAKMPIGMIFVPSRDGISHNKKEFTPWEDASRGMQVLSGLLKKINSQGGLGSDCGL